MLLSSSADNLQPRSSDHAEMSPWHLGGKRYSLLVQNKVQTHQHRSCTRWRRDGEREREMMDAPRLQKNAEKSRTLFFIHLLSDRSDGPFFSPSRDAQAVSTPPAGINAKQNKIWIRSECLQVQVQQHTQHVQVDRCSFTITSNNGQTVHAIHIYISIVGWKNNMKRVQKFAPPPSLIFCLYNCLHPYMYKERTEQLCNVHRLHISSWHVSSLFVSFENKRRESNYTPPSSGQVYIQSTLQTIQVSFAALGDVWFGPVLTLINQFSWHWFELSEWIASPF